MTAPDNEITSVRRQFGRVAAEYATSSYHASGPDLISLVKAARLSGSELVLDVGCGAGHTALALAPHAGEVIACDVTEAMLEQTARLIRKRGLGNVTVCPANAAELPFRNREFDVVACRVAGHHFTDIRAAVGEFARVLGTGGRLLIADSYSPSDPPGTAEVLNELERLRDPSHVRDYLLNEWLDMLSCAGFRSRVVETWNVRQDFDGWVQRMRTPAAAIVALKSTMDATPKPIRKRLGIVDGAYDVDIPIALIVAEANT